MANWTQIECGFDSANETINFGARNLAEGDTLSETHTLAVLRTDSQALKEPQVQCLNRNKKLFLAIDNTFRILTNNCYDIVSFRTFECSIDAFGVSSDDNLVVLCLNDGSIHCLHIPSDGKLVCSVWVPEQFDDNNCFISIFAYTNKIDEHGFLICTKNNSYRLQINKVQEIYTKILESDELFEDINFSFEKFDSVNINSGLIHLTYEKNYYYATSKYKRCFGNFYNFVLVLTEDGEIMEICKKTHLQYDLNNEKPFKDFMFLKSSNIMEHQLLTYQITSDNDACIKLLSYPDLENNYEVKVSRNSYLVTSDSDEDDVMFIEGFYNHGSDYVNELRLKVITESIPEVKLQRLLRKKLFSDAKNFAAIFNLSMDPIFKAQAEEFIIESDFQISDIVGFRNILDSINDIEFVVQCCLDSKFDTLGSMKNMLKYANKRLYEILQNNPENTLFLKLKYTILKTLFRLDAFNVLYPKQDFLTHTEIIDTWVNFCYVDLFKELCNYLKDGKIDKCTLIFNRFYQEIQLDVNHIQTILSVIPVKVPLMELLPFYRYLLTYSIKNLTICVPQILLQIRYTILQYDIEKSDGLNYVLNFAAHIQTFLYTAETDNLSLQKFNLDGGCLSKFRTLINCLNEMVTLKNEFSIKIAVVDYMRKPEDVIELLLDKITLTRLEDFLNQFLFLYCSNNNLNSDEVLSDYMKKTCNYQQGYWEQTASCLVPHINSNSTRMEVILQILESADVPWSGIIEKIANKGANESHPLAEKIIIKRENIPWKFLLKKYSFLGKPSYTDDDIILFIRRILLVSKPEFLDDLNAVLVRYPHLKDKCSIFTFNHFVQNGKPDEALRYVDTLGNQCLLRSFQFVLLTIQNFIFTKFYSPDFVNNYWDILFLLLNRLEQSLSIFKYNIYKTEALRMKNMYILKRDYNCDEIDSENFDLSTLIPKLVSEKLQSLKDNNITWDNVVRQCVFLSHLLGVEKEKCLLELTKQTGNLEGLNHCAEIMLECDSSPLDMCAMATNIMLNLDYNNISEQDEHISIMCSTSNVAAKSDNKEQVVSSLSLVNKLAITAIKNADYFDTPTALTLLNWTSVCHWYKTKIFIPTQNAPVFAPEYTGGLTPGTTKILRELFTIFVKIAGTKLNYALHDPDILDAPPIEEEFKNYLSILRENILQLHVEGCDFIAYQVLNVFKNEFLCSNTNPEFINLLQQNLNSMIRSSCVTPLLDKTFAARRIDLQFAMTLCLTPKFQIMKWIFAAIKKYKSNAKKLTAVANLGDNLCCYMNMLDKPEEMHLAIQNLKNRCHWWKKLLHQCVSYNDTFQLDCDKIIIEYLFKCDKFSLSLLKQFCEDFLLNVQIFLPQYLRYILLHWKPNVEFVKVPGSHETLLVQDDDNGPYEKCKEIIALMVNKRMAVEQLNHAWNEISYYQYEVYLCILDLLQYLKQSVLNPEMKFLLLFLKSYLRIRKPQQKEIDDWQSKYPFAREIDPLSEYRLPLLLALFTNDVWEIIRPEINLLTYDRWFETSTILKLDKDDICTYAIKGTVYSGAFNSSDTKWAVSSRNESLINNLDICVSKITNLEVATAALYQAVCKVSGGADQVAIAKMCLKMAVQWNKSIPNDNNISEVLLKVKRKYLNCISMHILYTYNIGTNKFLSLIENTEQLIRELYLDESIIERTKGTIMYYPDINAAVDQFGEQLGTNVESIRTSLVMEFLLESSKNFNLDDTFFNYQPQPRIIGVDDVKTSGISNNLKRVIYICESSQSDVWKNLLLNISFQRLDETISEFITSPDLSMRTKALNCLSVITKDTAELEEMIEEPIDTYLEKLQILMTLESLGYSLTVEELDKCNKTDLICKILRTNSSNSVIVQSLAKLSARYDIWDSHLWNKILRSFINLTQIADLQEWLPKLYHICYTPGVDCCFLSAWECLIRNSFLVALHDKANYEQGLYMIQMCPIIEELEQCLIDIFHKLVENNIFDICAILLTYIEDTDKKNQMQKVLEPYKSMDLFDRIKRLSSSGLRNIDYAVQLLSQFHL